MASSQVAAPTRSATTTEALWHRVAGTPAASHAGHAPAIRAPGSPTYSLDRVGMLGALTAAPLEYTDAARTDPLRLALPGPDGKFQRFAVQESPIMEPGLARLHPDIRTYNGLGIDDPAATIRIAMTRVGFTASVRGQSGSWFIDPLYHLDQSLYVSYFAHD